MGSYLKLDSDNLQPCRLYEQDFKEVNDFTEFQSMDMNNMAWELGAINNLGLGCFLRVEGIEDNKLQTSKGDLGQDAARIIEIVYFNKNNIHLKFLFPNVKNEVNDLLDRAAEKFYLMNNVIKEKREENYCFKTDDNWLNIKSLIKNCHYFEKRMTVSEAEELFRFLGITIKFPK